ncbi:MAG: GNAT family N-acetyltransferase, partial [Alphaproteobacteria bacterium]|nr:GNAT family N-acetyltransferase [Alphaproteobacteria bacterium]
PAGRNFRHLNFLGVLPEHQGQGIGTRLLAHGLARLDRERMAGYVETVNPRNARWYERFGFRLERTVAVGEDGPTIHCLWREPERPA